MSAIKQPHSIANLSFVKDLPPKSRSDGRQRCFWDVQPTSDYGEDCRTGHRFAIEYMRFELGEKNGPGNLFLIVADMPEHRTPDGVCGIQLGFLNAIGRAARYGLADEIRLLEHWDRSETIHGALVRKRLDGSVVIEQPDGTRGVYRRE